MLENISIEQLRSIGPKRGEILRTEAGIRTVEDLLYYAPRRYLDRSSFVSIASCSKGDQVTVAGTVVDLHIEGYGRKFLSVIIDDGTDALSGIFFGGIQYFQKLYAQGDHVVFSGKVDIFRGRKQITHPEFDFFENDTSSLVNTGRIIPLYPSGEKLQKAGFSSRGFRRLIFQVVEEYLDKITDPVPEDILTRLNLMEYRKALRSIHFPDSLENAEEARLRLAFNELYFLQYYLQLVKRNARVRELRPSAIPDMSFFTALLCNLPFTLTEDQKNVINEISADIASPWPVNRLIQGDVGSGKTVVAIASACIAHGLHRQTAVMAPTEVLAQQHFTVFSRLLPENVRCALLTGSLPAAKKRKIAEQAASGDIDILIGTHALIQDAVLFKNLGLVVVDEQHRFGVEQRAKLRIKGENADILVMTATPIPRSLALTAYGDLELSVIKQKPKDRLPVKTMILPEAKISGVYKSVEKYICEGRQCFIVFPLIEESEKSDLASAKSAYEELKNSYFSHRRIDLLHGKMKSDEKQLVMQKFNNGETDILISTTVIEVGVDVPNATVMVIRHPERFGLSQLHQLRGRVGRGKEQSFCILVYPDSISASSKERLSVIEKNYDGFIIAEEDLRIRGAGDFLGSRQHGEASQFEFADMTKDIDLLLQARSEAERSVSAIKDCQKEIELFETTFIRGTKITGSRISRSLSLIS